ncbi:MAG: Propeptide, PepSY amd peptidase [Ramlibacter sp.]|jgi:hypothetical protein|nr:Propeptide, PepSY amd peptidase [Ramlibacter sp.]
MKAPLKTVCAALLLVASVAWADMSRDEAAAAAQRASGGRVLSVDKTDSQGRAAWRVKVVTPQGEVRVIVMDAGSGSGSDSRSDSRSGPGSGGGSESGDRYGRRR